jgi:type VI secretion system secreted protein VgrG
VVGGFYHQEMQPVFAIPEQQTRQGFRSRSTLRGTTQEFSELSFDDRKGDELIFLHAQKDYTTEVEHDQSLAVSHDRTVKVGRDETITVGHDHSLTSETGDIIVTAEAGKVEISAAISLTLRVAATMITLTPEGIAITSPGPVTTEATEVNITSAAYTLESAEVNIIAAVSVDIETAEFIAIPPPDVPL